MKIEQKLFCFQSKSETKRIEIRDNLNKHKFVKLNLLGFKQ